MPRVDAERVDVAFDGDDVSEVDPTDETEVETLRRPTFEGRLRPARLAIRQLAANQILADDRPRPVTPRFQLGGEGLHWIGHCNLRS